MRVFVLVLCCLAQQVVGQVSVSADTVLMGSSFSFTAVAKDYNVAQHSINLAIAEVVRIEQVISSWDPTSYTSAINAQAGQRPVKVPSELFELIRRAKKISVLSEGAFDISYASLDKVWDFQKEYATPPPDAEIFRSVELVNYNNIILNAADSTVFLLEEGMKIGFGAIGKGYAANRARGLMIANGATSGVVNAGGDLIAWGTKPNGESWSVGIADPEAKNSVRYLLDVNDMAVVTSGNYEKYVYIQDERYCHIIDPRTGWPVKGTHSVTIFCPDAELADALATTVFVLGAKAGLAFVEQLQDVECLIIDSNNVVHYTTGLKNKMLTE